MRGFYNFFFLGGRESRYKCCLRVTKSFISNAKFNIKREVEWSLPTSDDGLTSPGLKRVYSGRSSERSRPRSCQRIMWGKCQIILRKQLGIDCKQLLMLYCSHFRIICYKKLDKCGRPSNSCIAIYFA